MPANPPEVIEPVLVPTKPSMPEGLRVIASSKDDKMELVLTGKTLEELATQAEAFLAELGGEAPVAGETPKRGRGRPPRANAAMPVATASDTPVAASTPPTGPKPHVVNKDNLMQAMKELIATKGAEVASGLLKAEFSPATRSIEIPESEWERFVKRAAALCAPAPAPTAQDLV